MTTNLKKAQEEQEEQLTSEVVSEMSIQEALRAGEIVGSAKITAYLSEATGKFSIVALKKFADEKLFQGYGFSSMAAFLDSQPHLPNHATYHRQATLLEAEGEEAFNLLNSLKVPMSDRKWLTTGTIEFEGNLARIGDHEVDLGNSVGIKQLVKDLAAEIRTAAVEKEKAEGRVEKLETQVKKGTDEFRQLERNFDALNEGDAHGKSFSRVVNALMQLRMEVESRQFRPKEAEMYLQTLHDQICLTRDAYGLENFVFTDSRIDAEARGLDQSILNELKNSDDIKDDE